MRSLSAVSCAVLIACASPGFAQTSATCDQALSAPLQPRAFLFVDSRPAGLEIVGTDQQTIHITCKSGDDDSDAPGQILLRFSPSSDGGKLTIEGTHVRHGNNLQIRIEVPRRTNLAIRMFAGEVKINEVAGDKDINLYAGQITISDRRWDYRRVNASVTIGEVRAPVYDADKGGFFRSISRKFTAGEYQLHAHVSTGEIDLLGRKDASAEGASDTRKPD